MDTRPTTDRIKETLFNILQTKIPCNVFIDLCSGSGSIGIEAISRGARKCYFVENNKDAARCINDNLHFTKFDSRSILLKQDVVSAIQSIHEKEADIIFMDPPYQAGLEKPVLHALGQASYVTQDTLIIIEADLQHDFSWVEETDFTVIREKNYKTNKHVFLMRK